MNITAVALKMLETRPVNLKLFPFYTIYLQKLSSNITSNQQSIWE